MRLESDTQETLLNVVVAAALGAAAMYLLDPDKGRRRRAIGGDKTGALLAHGAQFAGLAARDLAHRARGLGARAERIVRRDRVPDDLQLIERVRAKLGRVVSHPHAIQIGAHLGRVIVSGPVLASEAQQLRDAVSSVPGVVAVEDHLVIHQRPESVSSLQDGFGPARGRLEVARQNWTPSLRGAAVLGGSVLALYGVRQCTPAGTVMAAIGMYLAARGSTNAPLRRLLLRERVGGRESEKGRAFTTEPRPVSSIHNSVLCGSQLRNRT